MENSKKIEWLKYLGAEILDYGVEDETNMIYFSDDSGEFGVDPESFEVGDSLKTIREKAIEYSMCCGEILDEYRICYRCKEHC